MPQQKCWFGAMKVMVLAMVLVLFSGLAAAREYKVLYRFSGIKDGDLPGNLVFDAAGNIYGTTLDGGRGKFIGTVFKLTPNSDGTWTKSTLYAFCALKNCVDGFNPDQALIFDKAGNLYGATSGGGAFQWGTVFKLSPNTNGPWRETVLYSFKGGADGAFPNGVIFDAAGNLYGTTFEGGGSANQGTAFKLTANSDGTWTHSVLYNFCSLSGCSDGLGPSEVILDQAGNLYGAAGGGLISCYNGGCGVIFKLAPNSGGSWTESVLHTFTGGTDGAFPGGVIFDSAGNLYGTTGSGGNLNCSRQGFKGCGLVFKLVPNANGSWTENVLRSFANDPMASPLGLLFDSSGNLYGSGAGGPANAGSLFKMTPNGDGRWALTVLHVFLGKPGYGPSVPVENAGHFYGSTGLCGNEKKCGGVIFELTP